MVLNCRNFSHLKILPESLKRDKIRSISKSTLNHGISFSLLFLPPPSLPVVW